MSIPRLAVGADLKGELAEPVHDLVAAADELQLTGELVSPTRAVLDAGKVGEELLRRRGEGGGDGVLVHASIHSFRV